MYSPQHLVLRDAGQDPAVPTRPASQTRQMKSPLSGGGGGPTSFPELCPHRREAHEWARRATSPPHQEEAEILSTLGKSMVLCGWLPSLAEGTQPGQPPCLSAWPVIQKNTY